jgi:hypothetical protein
VTVTSSEVGPATGAGDNYNCDILRAKLQVTLDGRRSTLSLIVKAKPSKGELAKVNILFCLMTHIRENRESLHTVYIFVIYLTYVYTFIYFRKI